ncbi:Pkinase-domain-containing protein [Meira miltonrushii]|uniref:non-specific serine/threonine protein kinase n=1 Tax=Meira miltonrushii TaxID=1280837 RepID=A0A316V3J6_9BASI|nr:Pkinase-domain-containing protein [Meira miltonrushii]PWN32126.1 Pkinase-domain-containing protein [Meira miltonrushii]
MAAPVSVSASTIEPGHLVGAYKLTREIGKGSFAVVYLGKVQRAISREDESSSSRSPSSPVTRVAIKVVTRKKMTAKLLDNLEEEIRILRTVRHANIVELLDCLKTEHHIYLVMQYCRMGDLSIFIKSRKRNGHSSSSSKRSAPEQRRDPYEEEIDKRYVHPHNGGLHADLVRSFLAQLAAALQFMRGKNIVHRDIKPQNLLLQEPEQDLIDAGHAAFIPQLKVADFGFARHLEEASVAETLCGSPLYMAPEILRYEKYNAKADLWSVGAVLFEMSVGSPPFKAANHVELLKRIDRGEDRIKFPDEKSEDALRREHARKVEEGRTKSEFVRPHPVDEDIKKLIRDLLRRRPIERLSFEDFFNCDVLSAYKASMIPSLPQSSTQTSTSSLINGQVPVATRIAPAVPSSAPLSNPARTEDKQRQSKQANENVPDSTDTGASTPPPASPAPVLNMPQHYFGSKYVVGGLKSLEDNVLETPGSSVSHLPAAVGQTKPSTTPIVTVGASKMSKEPIKRSGTNDDDRGYVLVDKRNVEGAEEAASQAKAKGGPSSGGWSPLGVVRRPSQLGRLTSFGAISPLVQAATPKAVPVVQANKPVNKETNSSYSSSPILNRLGSTPPNAPFALPPNARKPSFSRRASGASEASRLSTMRPPQSPRPALAQLIPASSSRTAINPANGQMQQSNESPNPSTSSSLGPTQQPTSALARAISMASIRLFGVPTGMALKGAEVRKSLRMVAGYSSGNATVDIAEQNLLCLLHEYGHKSYVLTEFADARLSTFFAYGPHQNNYTDRRRNSGSSLSSATSGTAEEDSTTDTLPSSNQDESQATPGEIAASEAYVLYVRSLSFVQRAIQAAEDFIESRSQSASRYSSPSVGSPSQVVINSLLALRSKFHEGSERASFARSKSIEEFPESVQQIDELIFSEALRIARKGALTELSIERTGDSKPVADQCLLHYGAACTMLQGLLDPAEQADELPSFAVNCVERFIGSITRRMACIQENYDNLSALII